MPDFSIGDKIVDDRGFSWTVVKIWFHEEYLCLGLFGTHFPDMMGGYRINAADVYAT